MLLEDWLFFLQGLTLALYLCVQNGALNGNKPSPLTSSSQDWIASQCSPNGSGVMSLPCAEGRPKGHQAPLLVFTLELLTVHIGATAWEDLACAS